MKVRVTYTNGAVRNFIFPEDVLCIDMISEVNKHETGKIKLIEF